MLEINFGTFPILETERLTLRQITMQDAAAILFLRSNDKVMEFIEKERPKTVEDAAVFVRFMEESFDKNEGINWVITLKGDPTFIGTIGLWRIFKEHHRAEIGYSLFPDFWQKGIISEAMQAVIRYGFYSLHLHSIQAEINPLNIASAKSLEKQGFVREAYFKEDYFFNGEFLDSAIYSLLERNFTFREGGL